MEEQLESVTQWLLNASSKVEPHYFQLPVAGREQPCYRERVYCYELYHHWRSYWTKKFPFSLGGEVDKAGHPLIRGGKKPDFLVHIPGRMRNLLVVEVKPSNATADEMAADLKKLLKFTQDLEEGNYYKCYLWGYGLSVNDWPACRERMFRRLDIKPDRNQVTCFVHEEAGRPAREVSW